MSDLYIETRGHGPRHVVLLHGWAMSGAVFAPLMAALESRCTLHVVDLPGHGRSRASTVSLQLAATAQAVAAVTPPALWLGWSLGGLVAMRAALDLPSAVQALAVLDCSPCFVARPDWPHGVAASVFRDFGADLGAHYRVAVARFLDLEAMGGDAARRAVAALRDPIFAAGAPDPRVLAEGIDIIERSDLRAEIPAIHQPSAWIAGSRDRLAPWPALQWAAAQCGGRFTRIEHAGHAPFIGFAAAIVAALDPLLEALP